MNARGILKATLWATLFALPMLVLAYLGLRDATGGPLTPSSFRFARPWLGLLAVLAPLALLLGAGRRRPHFVISRGDVLSRGPRGLRAHLAEVPLGLRATALLAIALGLMGPQSIHAREQTEREGIDIVVVLDMSGSMDATDIRPDRFRGSQAEVDAFIQRRPDDRIGAVVFGLDAYTLLPLTSDHQALRNAIAELQLGGIEGRSTAIGDAVGTALNRLRRSQAESRVIILLTDGESNAGQVSPQQAAELAEAMDVKIYTVLMGKQNDTSAPTGRDLFGRPIYGRADRAVNPELLQELARRTDGEYFSASDREALGTTFHTILDRLERTRIPDAGRVYADLAYAFLIPAMLLLLIERLFSALYLGRWR